MPTQFLANFPPTLGSEVAAGQHYMMIDSYESINAITTGATKLSSIGLYIPTGSLKTSFSGNYEPKEGAALKASAGQAGANLFDKAAKFKLTADAAAGLLKAATGAGDTATAFGQKMMASTLDKTGFVSASGNSPNNYMALVYGGPNTFREHTFLFKFFPKNVSESNRVKAIIEEFKRGTLPRMSNITGGAVTGSTLTDPFFKSPRQHTIKFMHGGSRSSGGSNPYLFEIGKSVINDMKINYDPQSNVGFHSDGSPVQVDMSLTFKEIAFQISQDNVSGQANFDLPAAISQNQSSVQSAQQAADDFTTNRLADFARTGDTSRGL